MCCTFPHLVHKNVRGYLGKCPGEVQTRHLQHSADLPHLLTSLGKEMRGQRRACRCWLAELLVCWWQPYPLSPTTCPQNAQNQGRGEKHFHVILKSLARHVESNSCEIWGVLLIALRYISIWRLVRTICDFFPANRPCRRFLFQVLAVLPLSH